MLLTVEECRSHVTTSLSDDALLGVLLATEADVDNAAGVVAQTEYLAGGYADLVLAYPAGTISTVVEHWDSSPLTLAASDYLVDGYILRRLTTGTNPRTWWYGPVKVTHSQPERLEERKRAQVALVRLELTSATGISAERMGDYSVSYGVNMRGPTYPEQRQAILASLQPVMVR